eukprot:4601776-Pleurochrysis_carterae.AAC.2
MLAIPAARFVPAEHAIVHRFQSAGGPPPFVVVASEFRWDHSIQSRPRGQNNSLVFSNIVEEV